MSTLTIFTPTYNRAHTLPRLCESLARQTLNDFLWLVVDDGSTDGTRELVSGLQARAPFPIEYVFQVNQGKHNAHNTAVGCAHTELFLIIDSDDELLPNAVEVIVSAWKRMTPHERTAIAGIWTLCRTPEGKVIGGSLPSDAFDMTLQELRFRHKDNREFMPAFETAVLRDHPFPVTPPGDCPFLPEDYVWTRITRTRAIRFLNVPCRIYHEGAGLLTMARDQYRWSRPAAYGYFAPLTNEIEWFWYEPLTFLMSAVQAARFGMFSGDFGKLAGALSWKAKLLVYSAVPVAMVLLWRDRLSGRIARQLGVAR